MTSLEAPLVMPSQLSYADKQQATEARSHYARINSDRTLYNAGDTVIIDIPTNLNEFLDPNTSSLCGTVKCTSNAGGTTNLLRLDSNGFHSLFSRVRVYAGSQVLQDIQDYNLLSKLINVYSTNTAKRGLWSITEGGISNFSDAGAILGEAITASTVVEKKFALNLIGLMGSSESYIPLSLMYGMGSLRIELTIEGSPNTIFASSLALASIELSSVFYNASIIRLNDPAMRVINERYNGQLVLNFHNYKTVRTDTVTTSTGSSTVYSAALQTNYASVKSIFFCMRNSALLTSATVYSFSLCSFQLQDFQMRIGTGTLPLNAVDSLPLFCFNMCRCFAANPNSLDYAPCIDSDNYGDTTDPDDRYAGVTATNGVTQDSGCFASGLDLQQYPSSKNSHYQSLDLVGGNASLNMTFGATTAAYAVRLTVFAMLDTTIIFTQGSAVVKS